MAQLTGTEKSRYVQGMFARIAHRYDLMNRLMTGGQDRAWRRLVLDWAALPAGGRLLDLGAGTGDIAFEALQRVPGLRVCAADFTVAMMRVGQAKPRGREIAWAGADALCLPYPDGAFDAVTSGFLMRNVADVRRAFAEQRRVARPGGHVVCLDTTPPPRNWLRPFIEIHLHTVIPTLGRLLSGQRDAYTYLPDSTEGFLAAERLKAEMEAAGLRDVRFKRLMFNTIAVHVGVAP
jgi:demethylmenaquinone methyltransferase/2-methoxy-6-polyprenyl-1,4-benzoquinol methylase